MSEETPADARDFAIRPDAATLSPNRGARKGAGRPTGVVLHYTAMATAEAARARLCDPDAQVSAHYLISETGYLWGLVPESERAWHAGRSAWRGETDVNSLSIGVELAHPGGTGPWTAKPFPEPQIARLEQLLAAILARWSIPPEAVLGHSDVAPGRKIDPGETFDWARLARRGLARTRPAVDPAAETGPADPAEFAAALAAIGYGDWPAPALLDAFRRRWRPEALAPRAAAAAPLEAADLALARALASAAAGS